MKKFILRFAIGFAVVGALLTVLTITAAMTRGWNPESAAGQGLALLVAIPASTLVKAIGAMYYPNPPVWLCLALAVNVPLWFGLGALTGALAWRWRKSSLMARLSAAAALLGLCFFIVINLPGWFLRPVKDSCINNLRQMDGAKAQWALELHKTTNDTPTWEDLRPYLKSHLQCPDGGTYTIGRVGELPSCTDRRHNYFFQEANREAVRL